MKWKCLIIMIIVTVADFLSCDLSQNDFHIHDLIYFLQQPCKINNHWYLPFEETGLQRVKSWLQPYGEVCGRYQVQNITLEFCFIYIMSPVLLTNKSDQQKRILFS